MNDSYLCRARGRDSLITSFDIFHAGALRPIKRVLVGYKRHAYLRFFDHLEHVI